MTWPDTLPIVTGILYTAAAVGYWRQKNFGLSIAFAGYAFANIGLVWAALEIRRTL